ncbi:MAG: DUF4625 domain-containing protein [Paludibacteraceae bacterium]
MMNSKFKILTIFFSMAIMTIFTSCEKDEDIAKPIISGLELGIGNSHKAYAGADLHIEAEIVAEGKISKIVVEIHKEEGDGNEIAVEYTEYVGLKNINFHKHVDIPSTAATGAYHCHITVTDMNGQSTTIEEEIGIEQQVDTETLAINNFLQNGRSSRNTDMYQVVVQ